MVPLGPASCLRLRVSPRGLQAPNGLGRAQAPATPEHSCAHRGWGLDSGLQEGPAPDTTRNVTSGGRVTSFLSGHPGDSEVTAVTGVGRAVTGQGQGQGKRP